ncbi:MAG: hypothetical protein FD153_1078 [Rhodospirillaceae bacterium]|nr:MAG: hypothetical protein FD153_1078 [Rhodospirillaceae bacterium]
MARRKVLIPSYATRGKVPGQQLVGMDKWPTEEQIVMQEPGKPRCPGRPGKPEQAHGVFRPNRFQQLTAGKKCGEHAHVIRSKAKRRFSSHGGRDCLRFPQMPAGQDFEGRPVQAKKAVAQGIMKGEGRRAISPHWPWVNGQFIPQG